MTVQRLLPHDIAGVTVLPRGRGQRNLDIGHYAFRLDGAAVRSIIEGDGELEGRTISERNDILNGSLAEGTLTNNGSTLLIPERASHDFRSGSGTGINEHDHWNMYIRGFRRSGVRARHAFTAALDGHDGALCQEGISHAHGLLEQTSGVAAEIQHNSLESALRLAFLLRFGQSLMQFLGRLFGETGHVHPVIPILEPAAFDADKGDGITDEMHFDRLLAIGVQHGQIDARILGTAQAGNDFLHGHFLGGLAVYEQNDITCLHTGLEGRRVLNGRHHSYLPVLHGKFDANAEELSGRRLLHLLVFFCAQKGGMRIKPLQHSLNGAINKIALAHFFHVGLLNDIKNLAETAD